MLKGDKMKKFFPMILFLLLVTAVVARAGEKKGLLIMLDGTRADALLSIDVPNLDSLRLGTWAEGYKGAPETEAEQAWLASVIAMVKYMEKTRTWAQNIVQMHVDEAGDIVMIPREGRERFIFGSPTEAKAKFDRMSDYYRYILPEKGEGYYGTVNVKFDKQIVCKK